jgi:hypothetical protein
MAAVLRTLPDLRVERIGSVHDGPPRPGPSELELLVDSLLHDTRPSVLLVDDADLLDDGGVLLPLLQPGRRGLHVVAAGRGDRLRGLFRHWTIEVRRARLGVLLRADESDGDLLGVRLPRRTLTPWAPGRGWLVRDDEIELCQLARAGGDGEEEDRCA